MRHSVIVVAYASLLQILSMTPVKAADVPVRRSGCEVAHAAQCVAVVKPRRINEYYDFFQNIMFRPGELAEKTGTRNRRHGQ